jgi:hypothetical protein
MSSLRRTDVDGRELVIVDDFLHDAPLRHFSAEVESLPFVRLERDRSDIDDYVTWVTNFDVDVVARQPYFRRIETLLASSFTDEHFTLRRAYANSLTYGDMAFGHRDCSPESRDVTALLFLTPGWQRDWGGETLFFADSGEAAAVVSPAPGRLLLFRGAIEHRGSVPQRECKRSRLTLVLKLTAV